MAQRPRREQYIIVEKEKKVDVMMSDNILLYSWINAHPNCHQRYFIQPLMETDAKTHSQSFGRALGILVKRGKDCLSLRDQGHHKGPTEVTNLGLKERTESDPTTREPACD